MDLLYTAAHSGFDLTRVPLGGGAAVCEHLRTEWNRTQPFLFQVLGPDILLDRPIEEKNLVALSERGYARFSRAFEHKTTELILGKDPRSTVVLCNDVSEGPDFQKSARAGFSLFTIFHVDVVEYVSRVYLKSILKPAWLTKSYATLGALSLNAYVPDVLKLVLQKQEDCVRYSKGLILPSKAMKDVMMQCYPETNPAKIHIIPWGIWKEKTSSVDVAHEREQLRRAYAWPDSARLLLTLSRISPEKGQDRLLRALACWEASGDYPKEGVALFIAGEAAFMQGRRFEKKLKKLAKRLRRTAVHFVGYASGARKQALFEMADLYVFPSRHESYGLTLLEAMQAGLPVLACDDHGTRDLMRPEFGVLLPAASERAIPKLMKEALVRLTSDSVRLKTMGHAARAGSARLSFSETARNLAALLKASPTLP